MGKNRGGNAGRQQAIVLVQQLIERLGRGPSEDRLEGDQGLDRGAMGTGDRVAGDDRRQADRFTQVADVERTAAPREPDQGERHLADLVAFQQ